MKSIQHLLNIQKQDNYGTPADMFEDAKVKYEIYPTLDVCAGIDNHKCNFFYSKYDDGLTKEWREDFFMNPPYSEVNKWMKKAYFDTRQYKSNALILIYAKTDTHWWHSYVENKAEVYFIEGRVKFLDEFGNRTKKDAPYPSCWIVYRND